MAVDRLEVLLAGEDEAAVGGELGMGFGDLADHLADAVLDEAGVGVRLLDDRALVLALHQLVDLRRHRALDDPEQLAGVDLGGAAALGAAEVEGALTALVVGGDGDAVEDLLDLGGVVAALGEALAGAGGDELLGAGAGGHALGLDAGERAGAGG